jgi:hypothetical protein
MSSSELIGCYRPMHPQGVGRGCTGLKPQHHTLNLAPTTALPVGARFIGRFEAVKLY